MVQADAGLLQLVIISKLQNSFIVSFTGTDRSTFVITCSLKFTTSQNDNYISRAYARSVAASNLLLTVRRRRALVRSNRVLSTCNWHCCSFVINTWIIKGNMWRYMNCNVLYFFAESLMIKCAILMILWRRLWLSVFIIWRIIKGNMLRYMCNGQVGIWRPILWTSK